MSSDKMAERLVERTKQAGSDTLGARQTKVYEDFIKETGAALPKALEGATKSLVKLVVMSPRGGGSKFQLSFDGYMLQGGRGEKMPDFIGRVVVQKKPTSSNFLDWEIALQGVGRRGEVGDKGHVGNDNSPASLADSLGYALKRAFGEILR